MKRMKKKVYIITLYHDFIFTIPEHFTCTKTATVIDRIGCDISKKQFWSLIILKDERQRSKRS